MNAAEFKKRIQAELRRQLPRYTQLARSHQYDFVTSYPQVHWEKPAWDLLGLRQKAVTTYLRGWTLPNFPSVLIGETFGYYRCEKNLRSLKYHPTDSVSLDQAVELMWQDMLSWGDSSPLWPAVKNCYERGVPCSTAPETLVRTYFERLIASAEDHLQFLEMRKHCPTD